MSIATVRRCAAIARRTAEAAPQHPLPCPACGAEVKGQNLDKHLSKVHTLEPAAESGGTTVAGSDHRMQYFAMLPAALVLLGLWPVVRVEPSMQQLALGIWIVGFLVSWIPAAAGFKGKFSASIEVLEDRAVLRTGLGLLQRELAFPLRIATGSMQARRQDNMVKDGDGYRGPSELVHVGQYMELRGANGKRMVLGAPKSTAPHRYWEMEHEDGGVRRIWDVDFTPDEFVRLQYLLLERAVLRPKPPA